jgi:hypothetical protein
MNHGAGDIAKIKNFNFILPNMNIQKLVAILFIIISAFLNSCHGPAKAKDQSSGHEGRRYVALQDITYQPAQIEAGTRVEILAYLGGREDAGDTIYYYPFIVINQKTLDTNVIFCPEITIDKEAGIEGKTSASPLLVNLEKGVTNASFESLDKLKMLPMSDDNLDKLMATPDSANIEAFLNPQNLVHIVVLDKKDIENKMFRFKAAVGKLNFKQIPW